VLFARLSGLLLGAVAPPSRLLGAAARVVAATASNRAPNIPFADLPRGYFGAILVDPQGRFDTWSESRDTAAGALLVKVAERKATLLGLNAPIGHAVRVVQHPPEHCETSTDKIERALDALLEDQRRSQNGQSH
jgi:hypothetical protein